MMTGTYASDWVKDVTPLLSKMGVVLGKKLESIESLTLRLVLI